jgi:hypothetical protein
MALPRGNTAHMVPCKTMPPRGMWLMQRWCFSLDLSRLVNLSVGMVSWITLMSVSRGVLSLALPQEVRDAGVKTLDVGTHDPRR